MQFQSLRLISIAGLLTAAPAVWAHPSLFEGGPVASLLHLLTQPDHLLILAGLGLVVGIVWRIRRKA